MVCIGGRPRNPSGFTLVLIGGRESCATFIGWEAEIRVDDSEGGGDVLCSR